jgi:hypothetical protein
MLFHYGCVSVSSYVWKVVWLFVLSCIYCRTWRSTIYTRQDTQSYKLSYIWTHWHTPIMKQHKTFDNIYKTRHTIIQTFIHMNYECVSVSSSVWKVVWLCVLSCIYCRTPYVVSLWVCVSEFICMKVCMFVCLVLYILSNVLCCSIMGVYQWVHNKTHNHTNFHTDEPTDTHS